MATEIFVPQGIAVVTYDKRGVGASTGVFEAPGAESSVRIFADLAGDVLALVGFVKRHGYRIRADRPLWHQPGGMDCAVGCLTER